LLPLWRDRDTVQIGIDPRRAVAITGMSRAADVIRLLDGSRDRTQVITEAAGRGIPEPITERILTLLAAGGVLIDFPAEAIRSIPRELRRQLIPELAAASLARLDGDGGAQVLARRTATTIAVCGSGRIAASIADLLTCSGVAAVRWPAEPTGPGRLPAAAGETAAEVSSRAAPQRGRVRQADQRRVDLAILVGQLSSGRASALQHKRVPHLVVSASEAIGIVGPLVRPGVTACLRCLDLTRADRDPAWPLILAQLATRSADPPACDAALATAVAAQAAAQAIAFADQAPLAYATANGTLELALPAWQWRRRTWPPHPRCACGSCAAWCGNRYSA